MKRARDPEVFRDALAARGLTHRELAKLADCAAGTIGHVLNGRSINSDLARRFAGYLRRTTDDLFVDAASSVEPIDGQRQAVG